MVIRLSGGQMISLLLICQSNLSFDICIFSVFNKQRFCSRFVLFFVKKRNYEIADITNQMLVNWKSLDVAIYVHVFSLSMHNQAIFKKAKKILIDVQVRDRSGAATNAVVHELAEQLKDKHRFHYAGADIHWKIWANAILDADAFQPPPGRIIELFTRAPDHSDNILNGVQQNVSIGKSVNDAVKASVRGLRGTFTFFRSNVFNSQGS